MHEDIIIVYNTTTGTTLLLSFTLYHNFKEFKEKVLVNIEIALK